MNLGKTVVLHIKPSRIDQDKINLAAGFIRDGELVAFPTETVYGLGANAYNMEAVGKIFEAKGRPSDNPLIIHVTDADMLEPLIRFMPPQAEALMAAFWPGPLTLVFPKSEDVPGIVTAGLDTVAIRMPSHPVAHALISRSRVPIAAPSANLSGKPSPTRIKDVLEDMNGRIACIIDGGDCEVGLESTVLDITGQTPVLLRPGGVTKEDIEKVIGKVHVHDGTAEKPASPGMKYRHYAPNAQVILVEEQDQFQAVIDAEKKAGKRVGALVLGDRNVRADLVMRLGATAQEAGQTLFALLREMDRQGADIIIVESMPEAGRGRAVMNRLKKAASKK